MSDSSEVKTGGGAAISAFMGGASTSDAIKAGEAERAGVPVPQAPDRPAVYPEGLPPTSTTRTTSPADVELEVLRVQADSAETRHDSYNEMLRRWNMTEDEAFKIVDTLLVQDKRYRETVWLLKDKLPVVFQTQLVDDFDILEGVLGAPTPVWREVMSRNQWRHFIAAGVIQYKDRVFSSTTVDDYQERVSWVSSLQDPVFQMLTNELSLFNNKINMMLTRTMLRHF